MTKWVVCGTRAAGGIKYFRCNRSMRRKRNHKRLVSVRPGTDCASHLVLTVRDGKHIVKYCTTHTTHDLNGQFLPMAGPSKADGRGGFDGSVSSANLRRVRDEVDFRPNACKPGVHQWGDASLGANCGGGLGLGQGMPTMPLHSGACNVNDSHLALLRQNLLRLLGDCATNVKQECDKNKLDKLYAYLQGGQHFWSGVDGGQPHANRRKPSKEDHHWRL